MKNQIRQQIKEIIKAIPPEKKKEYSITITQKIIKKFGHLDHRHIYISMSDEVDTSMLIAQLQQAGKKIYYPDRETPSLRGTKQSASLQHPLDIIIVPGRAFTHDGKRLGRGKGYYDQFLANYSNTKKTSHGCSTVVGICFPQQILDDISIEAHDILMDGIITTE